jgi:hypothetical protein
MNGLWQADDQLAESEKNLEQLLVRLKNSLKQVNENSTVVQNNRQSKALSVVLTFLISSSPLGND